MFKRKKKVEKYFPKYPKGKRLQYSSLSKLKDKNLNKMFYIM